MTEGGIIIGGRKIVVPVPVHTWHDTGLAFAPANVKPRKVPVRWGVIHWTASERTGLAGAEQMHRSLTARGLSVEFMVTNDGDIYQFIDPAESSAHHCSRLNPFSVGVEVSGIGWAGKPGFTPRGDTARRRIYTDTVHGWKTDWFDFLPEQQRAVNAWADAMSLALGIDREAETYTFERRTDSDFRRNSGFCGHLHGAWLSKKNPKCDPGTAPLIALEQHFDGPPVARWAAEAGE